MVGRAGMWVTVSLASLTLGAATAALASNEVLGARIENDDAELSTTRSTPVTPSVSEPSAIAATGPVPDVLVGAATTPISEDTAPHAEIVPTTLMATPITEPVRAGDTVASNLRGGLVLHGATPHRLIMFSFDDGPDHRYTRDLLDELDHQEIRAVFFLVARRFAGNTRREQQHAEIVQEIARRGHVIGSHSMDHANLPISTMAELDEQIEGASDVFERVLGQRPTLFRAPGGDRSGRVDSFLAEHGYTQMLWNLGSGDAQVRSAADVVGTFFRVMSRREHENGDRGGIVLLHDIHAWSVEAFPLIVREFEERNCELLAQGEELYDFVDDPGVFFVERIEGESVSDAAPSIEPEPSWLAARQERARARAERRCAEMANEPRRRRR